MKVHPVHTNQTEPYWILFATVGVEGRVEDQGNLINVIGSFVNMDYLK